MWFDDKSQSLLVCDLNNSKLRSVQLNVCFWTHSILFNVKSGYVSNLCDISLPESVVVTSSRTILVSSNTHQIFKVYQTGLLASLIESHYSLNSRENIPNFSDCWIWTTRECGWNTWWMQFLSSLWHCSSWAISLVLCDWLFQLINQKNLFYIIVIRIVFCNLSFKAWELRVRERFKDT